ncbi:DUF3592 domain-containing protein [Hymenobacter guriensis]|uniref:DUF3592 domain-containing protein n=1 Tax=Hymenobacter guriensis TaxID=2793065 RepID=A0ABS0L126_9BACT|nr:DUF3592 domain-containing protein [Hymenobacter guriensis]MBG8553822.1 DUF3592 domain-containing protein [Hymenobacter guriensis]
MPTNHPLMATASIGIIGFGFSFLRDEWQHRYLRRHGLNATATILSSEIINQNSKGGPTTRLQVQYTDAAGLQQEAVLHKKNVTDQYGYDPGDELQLRFSPEDSAVCELEETLFAPWWERPVVTAISFVALGCYLLWENLRTWP